MRGQADLDDHRDPEIELLAVEHRYPASDDALLFELRDASPAGGRRESDGFGDFRCRARSVGLQEVENAQIGAVHMCSER